MRAKLAREDERMCMKPRRLRNTTVWVMQMVSGTFGPGVQVCTSMGAGRSFCFCRLLLLARWLGAGGGCARGRFGEAIGERAEVLPA